MKTNTFHLHLPKFTERLKMMTSNTLDVLSQETIRLIDCQIETLQQATLNQNPEFETWISHLENERSKLKNLEMVLAVIGTMKAGKSTTINAIVGMEILPNRETAMTTLPTLIRNKHGQTEPVLNIEKIQPLLELSQQVAQKLKQLSDQQKNAIDLNGIDDGKSLIEQLITENGYAFKTQYQGQNAIFEFLRHLNDIMRLAKDEHIAIEPPYHQYENVEDLPVIEVEFCHLKDHQDLAQGSLAILDTPGPNEFGQSAALRNVFKTQLEKASAVLLVTDFTQMKTEADQGVRDQLAEIEQYLSKDRLAVVVNKFDEQTENSMSADNLKKFIAEQLMNGKVDIEQVFPVSSRNAYLANRAKFCLKHDGKLPPLEPKSWVYYFAKAAEVSKKINDINAVKEGIETLWQESFFAEPIEKVIKEAHASAANKSLASAIKRLEHCNQEFMNTFNIHLNGTTGELEKIKEAKQQLAADIENCKQVKEQVKKVTEDSLSKLDEEIGYVMTAQKSAISNAIQSCFDHWKSKLQDQTSAIKTTMDNLEIRKNVKWYQPVWTLTIITTKGHKKEIKKIIEENEEELNAIGTELETIAFGIGEGAKGMANQFIELSTKDITNIFDDADKELNLIIEKLIEGNKKSSEEKINSVVNETLKKAENNLSKSIGVDINFDLPPIVLETIKVDSFVPFDCGYEINVEDMTVKKHKDTFWGGICKLFGTDDWGCEEVKSKIVKHSVNVGKMKNLIIEQLEKQISSSSSNVKYYLEKQFQPTIDKHLKALVDYLQYYHDVLVKALENHKLDESAKKNKIKHLTALLNEQKKLAGDIKVLNKAIS